MKPAVVSFVLAVLIVGAAFGEMIIVDSLEWMTIDSQLVVRGTVTRIADVEGENWCRDVTISVDETLKGESPGKSLTIRVRTSPDPQAWQDSGHTYLFFLVKGDRDTHGPTLAGHWTSRSNEQAVVDLTKPEGVYTGDMKRLGKAPDIVRLVRQYAKFERASDREPRGTGENKAFGSLRLEIPFDAEILKELYTGSMCFLVVPTEEKYKLMAFDLVQAEEDAWDRMQGAGILRYYSGEDTVKHLTPLLADPAESRSASALGELGTIRYDVRRVAYAALVALGEKPEEPVLEREPTDEEKQAFREDYWKQAMKDALPEGWEVVSVSVVESPGRGWKRTAGSDGVAVVCQNPKASLEDEPKPMPGHPTFTLYVMPRDWEGTDPRNGGTIDDGKFVRTLGSIEAEQSIGVPYLGHNVQGHFFCTLGMSAAFDARAAFTRYFGLTVEGVEPDEASE